MSGIHVILVWTSNLWQAKVVINIRAESDFYINIVLIESLLRFCHQLGKSRQQDFYKHCVALSYA